MFDLAAFAPDPWTGALEKQPNSALRLNGDFLSEDLCVLGGEHFLVRCVMEIPVHGLKHRFGFSCWGSLARENFESYIDKFDEAAFQGIGPWWSWLCNSLPPFTSPDCDPIGCDMFPRLDRQTPVLRVSDPDHPLAIVQRQGITAERVLEIYRHHGHEIAG